MSLLKILRESENARKIFGKREIKIIEKQLLGVNLTQSEKNRLSRDIRKKLEFIKEISIYSKSFNLKKGSENRELINKTLESIKKSEYFPQIKRIVLFGSGAERELTLLSDIDIAVDFDSINNKDALKFCLDIKRELSERLDIQVYNVLPEKIKKEIDKYGKILYMRDENG